MEIQILTEFHLKITMIGDDIDKKVILPQILTIFGQNSVQNRQMLNNVLI